MSRLPTLLLAGIFLFCTGIFNPVYSNTDELATEVPEITNQVEDEEDYSHESVLSDDLETEYEEPETDDVIKNDMEAYEDDNEQEEIIEEGEEV